MTDLDHALVKSLCPDLQLQNLSIEDAYGSLAHLLKARPRVAHTFRMMKNCIADAKHNFIKAAHKQRQRVIHFIRQNPSLLMVRTTRWAQDFGCDIYYHGGFTMQKVKHVRWCNRNQTVLCVRTRYGNDTLSWGPSGVKKLDEHLKYYSGVPFMATFSSFRITDDRLMELDYTKAELAEHIPVVDIVQVIWNFIYRE